ncbi:MAG: hypothetical protein QY306_09985 [Anaerolineales bacterium]|nr:MAG: hypothetical protein QY306_09985 [Anaerolineales bacterium]
MDNEEQNPSENNDYLEQLQWQSSFRRNWRARFTPKWKYRIVYNNEKQTLSDRIFGWLLIILLVGGLFFGFYTSTSQGDYGLTIAVGSIILLAVIFVLFAIRDSKKVNDDDDEDFE